MDERESYPLLGQLLMASGAVTPEELQEALRKQETSGELLGQILVGMAALEPGQLEHALRAQARLRGRAERSGQFVLVVDDDPEVGACVGDILEGAGYRVGIAQSEAEVFAATMACDVCPPALIVLDLGLWQRDGIEVLSALRENRATSDIPVVVLTGHPDLEPEIRRRQLQISDYLVKPVPVRRLLAAVESALSASSTVTRAPTA